MPRQSLREMLYSQAHRFGFFQAVAWLEWLDPKCQRDPVGRDGAPGNEIVRFSSDPSLAHPPGSVTDLKRGKGRRPDVMAVSHPPGLVGFQGVLPAHYKALAQERDNQKQNTAALRDWLDLFNHRAISLFYRAWEKYRFIVPFQRYFKKRRFSAGTGGDAGTMTTSRARQTRREDPDQFTQTVLSLVGLGEPSLRDRLKVVYRSYPAEPGEAIEEEAGFTRLTNVEDLSLLYFSGLLADRTRGAVGLQQLLSTYFQVPVEVVPFTGQWLRIPEDRQTRLDADADCLLGINTVCGERVWDVRSKFRVRVGPLTLDEFTRLLPDPSLSAADRKGFFLLCQLTRLYAGPEFDFDVRLVLRGEQVPAADLKEPRVRQLGTRLGWNSWLPFEKRPDSVEDAEFTADETIVLTGSE